MDLKPKLRSEWLESNVVLISFSAFFADLGYQAVASVFPLFIVFTLHQPAYIYGILASLSYGIGSLFAILGGKAGDRFGRKKVAIAGNLLIPLMSLSGLLHNLVSSAGLYVAGWWARYTRTPARRALLVELSNPNYRAKIFGFLHALDVGGGMLAAAYSILLILDGFHYSIIILITSIPILISSALLFPVKYKKKIAEKVETNPKEAEATSSINKNIFRIVLISATLFGFTNYALGFPIITISQSAGGKGIYGIAAFAIYLGSSAIGGYLLGSSRIRPMRGLWSSGYLLAAFASLIIGLSYLYSLPFIMYYTGAAFLGIATGAVETYEPTLISMLSKSETMSTGMGFLSSSRAIGLFTSNIVMGVLYTFSVFDSYLYAATASAVAAAVLAVAEILFYRI
ncbi:MAG: MFS transporter [Conexivisphaerales archaeon]